MRLARLARVLHCCERQHAPDSEKLDGLRFGLVFTSYAEILRASVDGDNELVRCSGNHLGR